jgi:transposase
VAKRSKKYTKAFKANAVRLAAESDQPIAVIARDLGVAYQTLYQWMVAAGKIQPAISGDPSGEETLEQEVRRLRRELDEVTMERDFLKKAAAFFAKQSK